MVIFFNNLDFADISIICKSSSIAIFHRIFLETGMLNEKNIIHLKGFKISVVIKFVIDYL